MKSTSKVAGALLLSHVALASCAHHAGPQSKIGPDDASTVDAVAQVEVAKSHQGMVVAGHPEAAEIGRDVLQKGGSAMDAAVAVSLALGVAEPYGSGLGGKLMMLYFDQGSQSVHAVDGMDESSSTLDTTSFAASSYEDRSQGWTAVAIPGLLAGIHEAHQRWGHRPWAEVVQPAIDLARSGALILPQTRSFFERRIDRIRVSREASRIFLPDGQLPAVGSRLSNPDLANTLESIAQEGPDGFYRGPVAEAIVTASQTEGGSLTLQDLAGYQPRFIEPLRVHFADAEVITAPPPASGGAALLAVLAKLDDAPDHASIAESPLEPDYLDHLGEILRRTYPEIQARIADVPSARQDFHRLIRRPPPTTLGSVVDFLGEGSPRTTAQEESTSTTHFVVMDAAGNIASVTQSLSHHFGAGVVAPGTGVLLNNTLKNFATQDTDSVNFVAPGKRPRSTIAPTLVFRNGEPRLVLGVPGGQRIPTATLQVLIDVLVFRTDLARAIQRPRVHLRRPLQDSEPSNVFELEVRNRRLARALRRRGWSTRISADNETFGGFCAIEILPDRTQVGVADLRRTNAARGL